MDAVVAADRGALRCIPEGLWILKNHDFNCYLAVHQFQAIRSNQLSQKSIGRHFEPLRQSLRLLFADTPLSGKNLGNPAGRPQYWSEILLF